MSTNNGRRRIASAMCAGILVAGVAACGTSSDSGSDAQPSLDTAALGAPNKASGTPISLGFISEGKGQALDLTAEINAAKAAVAYVNDYKGGIGGHPIELKVCESKSVPATATDCANQMVSAKVSAVLGGALGTTDSVIDVLAPTKIPLIMQATGTQKGLTTPSVFSLFNGLSYFGGAAEWAKKEGYSTGAQVVVDNPTTQGAAQIAQVLYKNAGVKVSTTIVPPGTADMSPQIASASESKPQFFAVTGAPDFCTSALKAIKTIDPQAKTVVIERCIAPGTSSSIPGGYQGVRVAASADLSADLPSVKTFSAVLAQYAKGTQVSSGANAGYVTVVALAEALDAAKIADITPAGVTAALKSAPPVELPNSNGIMFQCNGKQISFAPSTCSRDGILATADKDGNLTDYERIPADSALYTLSAG